MIKSDIDIVNLKASPTFKYIACWNNVQIQLIEVQSKNKTGITTGRVSHVNLDQQSDLMIYSTYTLDVVFYNIRFKRIAKSYKTSDRILKSLIVYPLPIVMTLSSKGQFQQHYNNKLITQIKRALWDDQRNYDFVYSSRNKLLILALKSGKLIFKGKQPLAQVYIHIPFHSLTLSPNEQKISAICMNQIFIYEIYSQKRFYFQLPIPTSVSWISETLIAVLSFDKFLYIWDVKSETKIKQRMISQYAFSLTGEGQNAKCLYITPFEDQTTKQKLIEWFGIYDLLEDVQELYLKQQQLNKQQKQKQQYPEK